MMSSATYRLPVGSKKWRNRPESMDPAQKTSLSNQVQQGSIAMQQMIHQGPLPPPQAFREYNDVLPDAANRILRMAETEQTARHERDRNIIDGTIKWRAHGQIFAFILTILVLGLAAFCISQKQIESANGFFYSVFGFMGLAFVYSKYESKKKKSGSINPEESK